MKKLSLLTRVLLGLGALVGVLLYLLIVDLGVTAGRIHYGVSVSGFDVGGMTSQEAVRALRQRRTVLRDHEVCFTRPGVQLCTKPAALGWYPSAAATARDAMRVGRDEAPFGALVDRLRAWVSGVTVQWDRGPRAWRVTRVLDDWEPQLARQGYALDRARLRSKLSRAILTYPRRDRLFPLEKR